MIILWIFAPKYGTLLGFVKLFTYFIPMINLFEHPVLKCTCHPFMSTELKKVLRETDIMIQFSSLWYFLSFGFWHSFSKWIIQRNSPRKVPPWKKFHSHRNHFHFIKNCIFRYCTSYFNRFIFGAKIQTSNFPHFLFQFWRKKSNF